MIVKIEVTFGKTRKHFSHLRSHNKLEENFAAFEDQADVPHKVFGGTVALLVVFHESRVHDEDQIAMGFLGVEGFQISVDNK